MPMSAPMGFLTATSNGTALCSAHEYCCIVTRYSLAAGAVHVSVFKSAVLLLVLVSTIYLLGPSTRRSPHHPSARVRRTVASAHRIGFAHSVGAQRACKQVSFVSSCRSTTICYSAPVPPSLSCLLLICSRKTVLVRILRLRLALPRLFGSAHAAKRVAQSAGRCSRRRSSHYNGSYSLQSHCSCVRHEPTTNPV